MRQNHNIALFASGGGSNAEAIIQHFKMHDCVTIALIVTNNANAGVLNRAANHGIATYVHSKEQEVEQESLLHVLADRKIHLIVLAGYMRRVQGKLLEVYKDKIVNIHPALLPKFGGKGMYGMNVHRAVVEAGELKSGPTIHLVNENYDEGNILAQFECELSPSDSPEDVQKKVLALEHEHYPKIIERLILEL